MADPIPSDDQDIDDGSWLDEPPTDTNRRGFLGFVTVLLGGIPLAGGLFAALRTGLAPAIAHRPERIPLCTLAEIPDDGILEVAVSFQMRQGPLMESVAKVVFVTRDEEGAVLAMSGECTHLSCPVRNRSVALESGAEAPLSCPCHGGRFSRTGQVLGGPPRGPLRRLRLDTLPDGADGTVYLLEV
jgi:nitrite reductase/ring-hydroxylating ferredoxin subunit